MSIAERFTIGEVSRLSGLPSNTIRTWERRYAVTRPTRTPGGQRIYALNDVERLRLIALLLDQGASIRELAEPFLPEQEIADRHPKLCAIERIAVQDVLAATAELLGAPADPAAAAH